MIYMEDGPKRLIILESRELEELRKGRKMVTPDELTLLCWSPDLVWLSDRLIHTRGKGLEIGQAIEESQKRPDKPSPRPFYRTCVFELEDDGPGETKYPVAEGG